MGTKVYSNNAVHIYNDDAVKLGFPDDIYYVMPGLFLGSDDPSLTRDVTVSFIEGNDCQYLDVYNPNIRDIGMEHNVFHEKHGPLLRARNGYTLYLPAFSGVVVDERDSSYYTEYYWSMSATECFMWKHMRYESYLDGICNYWTIKVMEPYIKDGYLRYGKSTWISSETFRYGQYDGVRDPNFFLDNHPELFTISFNDNSWPESGGDIILPEILSYPDKDEHILDGGIESACALEALNSLKANTNNVQNLFAIIDLAKGLLHPTKLPSLLKALPKRGAKSLTSDAWLKYRYVYKTTLSDIEEMTRFIIQGLDHSNTITLRGGMTTPKGTCRIRINAKMKDLSQFAFLQKYGVAPDLYNIWDSIPFSFVVDWFAGIGDFAQQISDQQWAMNFDIVSCTTSWKWMDNIQTTLGPVPFTHYQRFVTSTAPPFIPYSSDTVSDKTLIKRIIDGAALLLGK